MATQRIAGRKPSAPPKYGQSIHARTFVQMMRMLHDGDVSKGDLMKKLGLASGTVTKWLKLLGSDRPNMPHRLIYISGWRVAARGNPAALWSYGYETADEPKPPPKTTTEYSQKYRAKKRGVLQLVIS